MCFFRSLLKTGSISKGDFDCDFRGTLRFQISTQSLWSAPRHTGSPGPFGPGTPEESEKSLERVPRGRAPRVPKECAPESQKSPKRVRNSGRVLDEVLSFSRSLHAWNYYQAYWGCWSYMIQDGAQESIGNPPSTRNKRVVSCRFYLWVSFLFAYGWSLLLTVNWLGLFSLRLKLDLVFLAYSGRSVWSFLLTVRPPPEIWFGFFAFGSSRPEITVPPP